MNPIPLKQESTRSDTTAFALVGGFIGFTSKMITNRAMRRPAMYQPWIHVMLGIGFAYFGHVLGEFYDDTNKVLAKQQSGYASLPTWAYSQLSPEELDAELKEQKIHTLHQKYIQLASIEEKEYLAEKASLQ